MLPRRQAAEMGPVSSSTLLRNTASIRKIDFFSVLYFFISLCVLLSSGYGRNVYHRRPSEIFWRNHKGVRTEWYQGTTESTQVVGEIQRRPAGCKWIFDKNSKLP